jgi:hypothetical protein
MSLSKLVELKDIHCKSILENIESCAEAVSRFITLIDSQFSPEEQIRGKRNFFIIRSDEDAFKNDGNTHTPGFFYRIIWAFPLRFVKDLNLDNFIYFEDDGEASNVLYFCLEEKERCCDNSEGRYSRKVIIRILGNPISSYDTTEKTCIAYNNTNYPLLSVFTIDNAIRCVLKIRELYEWDRTKKSLEATASLLDSIPTEQ